jgi:hypothetical protein
MNNKGAILISFFLKYRPLCFIGAHLTSVQGFRFYYSLIFSLTPLAKISRRKDDYWKIIREGAKVFKKPAISLYDHDYVFIFGDLNFRLSEGIPFDKVCFWIGLRFFLFL